MFLAKHKDFDKNFAHFQTEPSLPLVLTSMWLFFADWNYSSYFKSILTWNSWTISRKRYWAFCHYESSKDITEAWDINYWRHDLLVAVNYAAESNWNILLSLLATGFAVITGNRVPVSVFLRAFSANLLPPLTVTGNDFVRRFHEWNHLSPPPPPCNNSSFL